jgi:hypothetical protein
LKRVLNIIYNKPFLVFFLFLLVAYLPVFLPYFHLKNDLISQNLPSRFVISESLYSGYFPWWNPYLHFGIPQYGDMNTGFWNPILWLIASTVGYSVWSITLEEMFYILAGGWGIYLLLKELRIGKDISLVAAISYMSCGYITGHLQHFCWITGTAFFPYLLLYILKLNKDPILKNYILGSFAALLFLSSTHPGLLIGSLYFLLFFFPAFFLFKKYYVVNGLPRPYVAINISFILFAVAVCAGVIISNLDPLPFLSRGSRVSLNESLLEPTPILSYISLLLPLSVFKMQALHTDISMRNVYIGLAAIPGCILLFKNARKRIILVTILPLLFFILLSAGGLFKTFAYYALPMLGFVRLNGEFSYFPVLILLSAASFGLHYRLREGDLFEKTRRISKILIWITLASLLTSILLIALGKNSILFSLPTIRGDKEFIKDIVRGLEFADLLLIVSLIQLLTLIALNRTSSLKKFILVSTVNLIIITWLSLPFTGLGMASKKTIQSQISVFPRGIINQELMPLNKTHFIDSSLLNELWLLGSYSKKIGYPAEEKYQVELRSTRDFYADSSLQNFIYKQSYIFLHDKTTIHAKTNFDSSHIQIAETGPGYLRVIINNTGDYHYLTFLQNDYPYWKVYTDGRPVAHFTGFKTFITISIPEFGKHEILFRFNPRPVRKAMIITTILVFLGICILLIPKLRNIKMVD